MARKPMAIGNQLQFLKIEEALKKNTASERLRMFLQRKMRERADIELKNIKLLQTWLDDLEDPREGQALDGSDAYLMESKLIRTMIGTLKDDATAFINERQEAYNSIMATDGPHATLQKPVVRSSDTKKTIYTIREEFDEMNQKRRRMETDYVKRTEYKEHTSNQIIELENKLAKRSRIATKRRAVSRNGYRNIDALNERLSTLRQTVEKEDEKMEILKDEINDLESSTAQTLDTIDKELEQLETGRIKIIALQTKLFVQRLNGSRRITPQERVTGLPKFALFNVDHMEKTMKTHWNDIMPNAKRSQAGAQFNINDFFCVNRSQHKDTNDSVETGKSIRNASSTQSTGKYGQMDLKKMYKKIIKQDMRAASSSPAVGTRAGISTATGLQGNEKRQKKVVRHNEGGTVESSSSSSGPHICSSTSSVESLQLPPEIRCPADVTTIDPNRQFQNVLDKIKRPFTRHGTDHTPVVPYVCDSVDSDMSIESLGRLTNIKVIANQEYTARRTGELSLKKDSTGRRLRNHHTSLLPAYVCPLLSDQTSKILDGNTNLGGASPHTGGRDESSLSNPSVQKRWIPPSSVKRDALTHDEKTDHIFRRVRGILNKLSPEKFDKLSLELLNVGIESQVVLKGVILLIFDKALDEPKYSSMYAQLCHQLCEDAPNFDPPSSNISTFRRLLLNKCQDEFENRSKATNAFDKKDGDLTDEEMEQYHIAKHKMLGNIKFVGELGKLEMLHETILHRCIKQLLEKKKNIPLSEMAEDLECLCQIMKTIGRRLDTPKAKAWMDQYFSRMKWFSNCNDLPSRIRFLLQDVLELRDNKWKSRRDGWDAGPITITQIRQEAADETGVYISQQARGGGGQRPPMNGSMGSHWKPGTQPTGGAFGDFFGMPAAGMMGSLGTGPGVIQMDGYVPNYNPKQRNNQQSPVFNNYKKEGGSSPRPQRHNNYQGGGAQQGGGGGGGGRLSPQTPPQQQSPQPQQQYQQKQAKTNLPPRLAKLQHQQQQQQIQQQQQQQQTMMMAADGQIPIPLPNTSVPPPPLPPKEEISLRPNRNFTAALRPSVPTMLPKSAQAAPSTGPPMMSGNQFMSEQQKANLNPLLAKQAAVTIKQVPQEKLHPKKLEKKSVPNRDEVRKAFEQMLIEYLAGGELTDAVATIKDLNAPKRYVPEVLCRMMLSTIEKTDDERENVMTLMVALKDENLITSTLFMDAFRAVLEQMSDLESDVALVKTYVARFAAFAVAESLITLLDLADPMEQGAFYPLFLICLQHVLKRRDKEWLVNAFNESKMDLHNMLPESDRSKERMMEILEERGLSFMFPLLRVQTELWKQIQAEPTATAVFRWIRDKVSSDLHQNPGFINVLTTSILRYVTTETTLAPDIDKNNTTKSDHEAEKLLLDKMKAVLQRFLNERPDLQMHCLYAAQVFCHGHQFPKGMLLRLFMDLYDMEVVEEETFLKWKEEVNDEYPGKGKALFQVNQWLTWLEQAEEESDDED